MSYLRIESEQCFDLMMGRHRWCSITSLVTEPGTQPLPSVVEIHSQPELWYLWFLWQYFCQNDNRLIIIEPFAFFRITSPCCPTVTESSPCSTRSLYMVIKIVEQDIHDDQSCWTKSSRYDQIAMAKLRTKEEQQKHNMNNHENSKPKPKQQITSSSALLVATISTLGRSQAS